MAAADEIARAEEVRVTALGYATGATVKWEACKSSKGVVVEKAASPEFSGNMFKGECVFDYSPEDVFFFNDFTNMHRPDKIASDVKDKKIVKEYAPDVRLLLSHTKSVGLGIISPREYLDLVKTYKSDELIGNFAVSVLHPEFPPDAKMVRGTNYASCSVCFQVPGNARATRLVNLIHSDAGGSLPRSVVERFLPQVIINEIVAIRDALKAKFKN